MKSIFKTDAGVKITVLPLPQSKAVMVWAHDPDSGKIHQIVVPLDLCGVFLQAVGVAAAACVGRPAVNHGVSVLLPAGLRCLDGDACKAGQVACPSRAACGVAA